MFKQFKLTYSMQAWAPDAKLHGLTQRAVVQHWEVSIHVRAKEIESLLRDRFGQRIMLKLRCGIPRPWRQTMV